MRKKKSNYNKQPSAEQRRQVEMLSNYGLTQDQIAEFLNISRPTLRKYCSKELERGKINARLLVTKKLFANIMKGREASIFFWLKCQGRWSERAGESQAESDGLPAIEISVRKPDRLKGNDQ